LDEAGLPLLIGQLLGVVPGEKRSVRDKQFIELMYAKASR
jgi:hypothetical protein